MASIGTAVKGESSASGFGVLAESNTGTGVQGGTQGGSNVVGVRGFSNGMNGIGVSGNASNGSDAFGVWGISTSGFAGNFTGNVQVTGTLTKGAGAFKIDHPLDPENKYLSHSFVESPDMKNIYDGVARLDAQGQAVVQLPPWFGALNKDFRYQLTAVGAPGPDLHVAEKIRNNRFTIAGGNAGQEVSWQVTGIRQDAYAEAHRIVVEEDKSAHEQGFFLHPEVFGQPEEQGIEWAIRPEAMWQMKAEREAQAQEGSVE